MIDEKCDRCGHIMTEHEASLGWPICMGDEGYIGPECYGDESYCKCGRLLSANDDTSLCGECGEGSE